MENYSEFELLLGCREQLKCWADCMEGDGDSEEQVEYVDELIGQLTHLLNRITPLIINSTPEVRKTP